MYEQTRDSDHPDLFNRHFFLSRREFLSALVATSAGLLAGAPSFAKADYAASSGLQRQVTELLEPD